MRRPPGTTRSCRPTCKHAGLPAVLKEVEQWADREYASILARGDGSPTKNPRGRRATGPIHRLETRRRSNASHLRSRCPASARSCSKQQRRSIGRFDSRYQGIENSDSRPTDPSFDPSLAGVRAPYTSTFNKYVRRSWATRPTSPTTSSAKASADGTGSSEMGYPRRPTPSGTP